MTLQQLPYTRLPETLFSGYTQKLADIKVQPISANTNILAENQPPTYRPMSFFLVYAVFENTGSLMIRRTFTDLFTTRSEILNENFALGANSAYIFAFPVSEDETINFWFTNDMTVTKLTLLESQIM